MYLKFYSWFNNYSLIFDGSDDYIDFNNNGICDEENGDTFLNDLAGNKQWDWDDANGNGVCDDGGEGSNYTTCTFY